MENFKMVQQGYYQERINELEKREKEAMKEFVQAKMSLKAVRDEKKQAFEYMNSAHYDANLDTSELESEIQSLKFDLKSKEKTIQKMNNTINKKNGELRSLTKIIEDKDHEISVLKLKNHNEQSKLEDEIVELTISKNKRINLKKEEVTIENNKLKKENREFKRNIKALNERIDLMDKTIEKKNSEIQILHERLNWQPKKHNIFEELLEEGK